jgi:hypothetical protein
MPPLASMCWPVIHLAFSDTNNSVMSAISSTDPSLAAALVCSIITASLFCVIALFKGSGGRTSVATGPGATEFTVIPRLFPNC